MGFIEVAKTEDIPDGKMKSFKVNNQEILVANFQNKYYAISGKCTHMGGELAKGVLEGKIVTCPRHGSKFDVTSGECIAGPKIPLFKPKIKNLAAFEVNIEGNSLKVNL